MTTCLKYKKMSMNFDKTLLVLLTLLPNIAFTEMIEDCSGTATEILACRNKNRVYKDESAERQHYLQKWQKQREYEDNLEAEIKEKSEANRLRGEAQLKREAAEEAYRNTAAGKAETAKRDNEMVDAMIQQNKVNRTIENRELAEKRQSMLREWAFSEDIILKTMQSYGNKPIPAEVYVRMANQSVPNWKRVGELVKAGETSYGGRFELLSAVLETVNCPNHDFFDTFTSKDTTTSRNFCDTKYEALARKKMLVYLPKANMTDKLLICGYMHASLYVRDPKTVEEMYKKFPDADSVIARKRFADELAADLKLCETISGDDPVLKNAREGFYTGMKKSSFINKMGVDEKGGSTQSMHIIRWYIFTDPRFATLDDFQNLDTLQAVRNTAEALSVNKPWYGKEYAPWQKILMDQNMVVLSPEGDIKNPRN